MSTVPYRVIAKHALINWNGFSEEEAVRKINTKSVEELEEQIGAMDSIKYAVIGLTRQVALTEEEATSFFEAVVNGPEDAEIYSVVSAKAEELTEEQQLGILSTIHDCWINDNSDESTFLSKIQDEELRQYTPMEIIGWNEVKTDLIFLSPILESIGIKVDERKLEDAYHTRTSQYLKDMNVNSKEDLTSLISQGNVYYPALPVDLDERLKPMSDIIADQIISNWRKQDHISAGIMDNRIQTSQDTFEK